jgi:HD superfamily phosphodiesterase
LENNQEKNKMKNQEISYILKLITSRRPFTEMPFGIHGRAHACRVLLFANMIANLREDRAKLDITAITISALLHDCGRCNDGKDVFHAVKSAEKTMRFIDANNIYCDKELVRECIIRHSPPPSYHNKNPSIESKIIGDADKLDRFRFHRQERPCNSNFFELSESKLLMDISARVNGHKWRSFR